MSQFACENLLATDIVTASDVLCRGGCRHRSPQECTATTRLVYPYRGVFVRHVGCSDSVAEANQVLFFNAGEAYSISHPVDGGDACLSIGVAPEILTELVPKQELRGLRRRTG